MGNQFTLKRWLPVRRNPLRQSTRDNRNHHHIPSPRCSYQLTNGSGRMFLPSTTSAKHFCHTESQRLTKKLRHHGSHREDGGAIDWSTVLPMLCRNYEYKNARKWTNQEWLYFLQKESDKNIFQHCLNLDGLILCMRVIQGHCGGAKFDSTLLDNVVILYKWIE